MLLNRAVSANRPLLACPFVKVSPGRTKPVSPEGVVCTYLSPRNVIEALVDGSNSKSLI
jgi:hypothetical protein